MTSRYRFDTRAVRAPAQPDPVHGSVLPPIVQSTTFAQEGVNRHGGYTYSRKSNPTVTALERALADLEGVVQEALCFRTGMAAITGLLMTLLRSGGHVVCGDVVYGGTICLLDQVLSRFGVETTYVDCARPEEVERALRAETRVVFLESPANPTMKLADMEAIAARLGDHDASLVVDNTFMTPVLQRPFEAGADMVVYSTTKYMDGHNATVGGALLVRDDELREELRAVREVLGSIQAPQEAFLTLQGLVTLQMRMERHCANALTVARFLEAHPAVESVLYPGLDGFAQRDLASRQQVAGGGMLAFTVRGGKDAGIDLMNRVELCLVAENLGAAQSIITHPASMTHASVPEGERLKAGIVDGLVRLSVGLENPQDIMEDLNRALGDLPGGA